MIKVNRIGLARFSKAEFLTVHTRLLALIDERVLPSQIADSEELAEYRFQISEAFNSYTYHRGSSLTALAEEAYTQREKVYRYAFALVSTAIKSYDDQQREVGRKIRQVMGNSNSLSDISTSRSISVLGSVLNTLATPQYAALTKQIPLLDAALAKLKTNSDQLSLLLMERMQESATINQSNYDRKKLMQAYDALLDTLDGAALMLDDQASQDVIRTYNETLHNLRTSHRIRLGVSQAAKERRGKKAEE